MENINDINFNNQAGPDPINIAPKREQPQLPVKPVFKKENNLHPLLKITAIIFIIFLLIASFSVVNDFLTDNQEVALAEKTITVSSSAKVYTSSDIAVVNIGVETSNTSLGVAVSDNFGKINTITNSILQEGVTVDAISRVEYSVAPKYQKQSTGITVSSYAVKEVIQVRMPIEKVESILQLALTSGASIVSDLSFKIENEEVLVQVAKAEAIIKAKEEAGKIAQNLNMELGDLINYSDNNLIEVGDNFISVNVTLTYLTK